ncbi:FHA domain-containing protein [Corynebacterium phoceense]|uniref:FHA domain-containing protein n=1 Tax=Corynebacterium phoceense TaxID=1686286 RepID=A0A540R7Z2_9CORY|nr:FHA domain-containing protein [Corynebacterium phoceense]TQE43822.1 FHA domain-containing protein [Corynebacterium phoceense]
MSSVVLLGLRIAILALLWIFILVALNSMRRDANKAAAVTASASPARTPHRKEAAHQISIVEGPLQGSHMALGTLEDLVLGRANECDFVTGDDYSSARHSRLFRRGSDWFVEDLESRNGTFVNGVRIDQPERVGVGTDIKMGRTTVRLMP